MTKVKQIYPGGVNGLIHWMEENFHDIDEFVVQFSMKDGTEMFVYETYSFKNCLGMLEMAKGTAHELSISGDFIPKPKE